MSGKSLVTEDFFSKLYHHNLAAVWDAFLPAPDIRVIRKNGQIDKVDQTVLQIAKHYFCNILRFCTLSFVPITFTLSAISSLTGRVKSLSYRIDHPGEFNHPAQVANHIPKTFGFASSRFQDSAEGTFLDLSALHGIGTGDWDKILKRPVQRVTQDGKQIGKITYGITLKEGENLEDLFVNIIDHPKQFALFLKSLGCTAYRTSLERSVMEPERGKFSNEAIRKYKAFYAALKGQGIEPWITLHHFTDPQWFEDEGGFAKETNIEGFVNYAQKMAESFPEVTNWMTFNEPGVRGLEGYVRGEHPPEHKNISEAAQVIRNLLIAHTQAYAAMKKINSSLNIGLTHQWLRFLPFGFNPIEKITAYFFTNLVHTPVFNFFKEGKMHIRIPFKANVQLVYEDKAIPKLADFLGVQAYGFPRVKVGFNSGKPYPGAADKVHNFTLSWLRIGFTAGSTCETGRMQYFGPPAKSEDLVYALDEAFTIPKDRIPEIGISETGRDAAGMFHGDAGVSIDNNEQAAGVKQILDISETYPLSFLFWWTLKRHCEWRSGGLPQLGLCDLTYKNGKYTFGKTGETPGIQTIRNIFYRWQISQQEQQVA